MRKLYNETSKLFEIIEGTSEIQRGVIATITFRMKNEEKERI